MWQNGAGSAVVDILGFHVAVLLAATFTLIKSSTLIVYHID